MPNPTALRYSGNAKIRAAQKRNERTLLASITRAAKAGRPFETWLLTIAQWNALDRLRAKHLVRVHRTHGGYVPTR